LKPGSRTAASLSWSRTAARSPRTASSNAKLQHSDEFRGDEFRGQKAVISTVSYKRSHHYDAKTGEEVSVQKRGAATGRYYASPVAANGHIYLTSLDEGATTVLKAGTATPQVVANSPSLGEPVTAAPVIADDALYVRTAGHLYAFAGGK